MKDIRMPPGLPHPLREYQHEGVAFLRHSDSALLADEMGLGKTVQTAVALQLALSDGMERALLVVPSSLKLNWIRELARWTPRLVVQPVVGDQMDRWAYYRMPIQVLVASYEQVRADYRLLLEGSTRYGLVVLDEAQRIKNPNAETSLACRILPRDRSWALTGTPLENAPADLVSVFQFLQPRLLSFGMSRREMHERIRPHFLRRRKSAVESELPPIIEQDLPLELGSAQRRAYDDIWIRRSQLATGTNDGGMLAVLTKLKQICNHDVDSGESVKLDALLTIIDGLSGADGKLLLFSQYVQTLEWLAERLPLPLDVFHGGQSLEQRDLVVTRFREHPGPRALLVSLKAGGVGLNIPEASTVVLYDRWWNPAVEDQAIQRAHRLGRSMPLLVYRFQVADTVEDRIQGILAEKELIFDEYVEQAPQADVPYATRQALRRILQLSESETTN